MHRKKIMLFLLSGVLVLAAAFGVVSYRVAQAQSSASTPSAPSVSPAQPGVRPAMRGGVTDEALATALGISTDQLQTARTTANAEALQQAIAAGEITQAQADQFAQGGQDGRRGGMPPFLKGSAIDYDALLAQALGISTDALQAAHQTAFTAGLDQAVQNGTLTQAQADLEKGRYALTHDAQFQAEMQSAYQAAVNQAVTRGVITQSQADQLVQDQAGMLFGGRGGPGPHGGGPDGPPPDGAAPPPSGTTQ